MNVKTLCLAILNIQDATGYEIKKLSIEGPFQHFVEVSFGSIYPTLAKLESENFVSCHTQAQDGKPDRKIYSITNEGRTKFVKLINVAPKLDIFKSEFLLLCLNADLASRELLDQAFRVQIQQYEDELAVLKNVLEIRDQPTLVWTANYGISTLSAKIDYLKSNKHHLLDQTSDIGVVQAAQ